MPYTVNLKIIISGKEYILGTLSFNVTNNRIFYLINVSEKAPEKQLYINTGQVTSRVNKISFHPDATLIKVKHFAKEGYKWKQLSRKNINLLPEKNTHKCFLVEWFILQNTTDFLSQTSHFSVNEEYLIRQDKNITDFSIVFLLVPKNVKTNDVLPYPMEQPKIRIDALKEYDLILFTIACTPDIDNKPAWLPAGPVRLFNYENPVESIKKILKKFDSKLVKGQAL